MLSPPYAVRRPPIVPPAFAVWRAEHHLFRQDSPRQTTRPVYASHGSRAFLFEHTVERAPPVGKSVPIWGFLDWLEGFRGKLFWQPYQPRRRVIVLERNFVIEDADDLEETA